ncbi:MAG: PAS domain-containing protein, partial [Thermoplasmata archaeon]
MAPTMNNTSTHRPVLLLILIMTAVAVGVGGIAGYALYATAFEQQRERLVELADSQAHLIQAVTRIEAQYGLDDYPGGAFAAPLSQIIEAHEKFQSFGQSGEFTLARLEGDQIVFLLSHRYGGLANPEPVPLDSQNAEPMRRALRGGTGTLIGLDYRGERVLAAYHLLQDLGLGIVAKIDLAEVRGPFIRTGILAGSASLLLISLGSVLFLRIGNPMVQRLKESERKYRTLVEQIPTVTYTALPDDVSTTLYISPQIEELLGFTPTEWVKDPDLFVRQLHPEDRARVMDGIAESRKRGDAFNSEFRMLARDGRALWFRDEARMMRDEAGRPLFLQGVMLDITDRKRRQDSEE